MELIKRYRFSRPLVLPAPFPIAAATAAVVAVFTRWALRIELQTPRERGSRCLLLSFLPRPRYDRPSPLLFPYQPLSISRLLLRNYRRISANTANESIWTIPVRSTERGIGEKRRRAEQDGVLGLLVPCWPAALKNFVKRGRRRVPGCRILGRRRARGE